MRTDGVNYPVHIVMLTNRSLCENVASFTADAIVMFKIRLDALRETTAFMHALIKHNVVTMVSLAIVLIWGILKLIKDASTTSVRRRHVHARSRESLSFANCRVKAVHRPPV